MIGNRSEQIVPSSEATVTVSGTNEFSRYIRFSQPKIRMGKNSIIQDNSQEGIVEEMIPYQIVLIRPNHSTPSSSSSQSHNLKHRNLIDHQSSLIVECKESVDDHIYDLPMLISFPSSISSSSSPPPSLLSRSPSSRNSGAERSRPSSATSNVDRLEQLRNDFCLRNRIRTNPWFNPSDSNRCNDDDGDLKEAIEIENDYEYIDWSGRIKTLDFQERSKNFDNPILSDLTNKNDNTRYENHPYERLVRNSKQNNDCIKSNKIINRTELLRKLFTCESIDDNENRQFRDNNIKKSIEDRVFDPSSEQLKMSRRSVKRCSEDHHPIEKNISPQCCRDRKRQRMQKPNIDESISIENNDSNPNRKNCLKSPLSSSSSPFPPSLCSSSGLMRKNSPENVTRSSKRLSRKLDQLKDELREVVHVAIEEARR